MAKKFSINETKNSEIANASKKLKNIDDKLQKDRYAKQDEIKYTPRDSSEIRRDQKIEMDKAKIALGGDISYSSANPYDNTPSAQKASKKDVLSLSTASYGNSLLEKIASNSNHLEYQNAVLKFQEKQVELLSTIASSVVAMGKVIVTSEAAKAAGESPEYQRNFSTMAKALGSGDYATAASEGFASIWKKVDRNGYLQLANSMVDLFKGMLEDGKIKEMFKQKLKDYVLDAMPMGAGDFLRRWENDPIAATQRFFNQRSVSGNFLDRMYAKDFAAFNPIAFKNNKNKTDWSEKGIYTKKTDKTINEIIPEYLAEILAAIRKDEAKIYDWKSEKFVGRTELAFREQKVNEEHSYKHAMKQGMDDFRDMAGDVVDLYGKYNGRVRQATGVLFNGKDATGKMKFRDEKSFNILMKRVFEKYGRNFVEIFTTPNMHVETVMKHLFGNDQAAIQTFRPMVIALHNMMALAAEDRERTIDYDDMFYQIIDWDEENREGRKAQTQHYSGNGSLAKDGDKFGKAVFDFAHKYDTIGANNAAAWGVLRKMSMGDRNLMDSAINSENTFINTNVVYLNAASVIGGGKGKKGKDGGGFINFPKFNFGSGSGSIHSQWKDILNKANATGDAASMNRGDQANYYAGRNLGAFVADGDFGAAGDQEEFVASQYSKYSSIMTEAQRSKMSAAWKELGPDSSQEEINETLRMRKAIEAYKTKWDVALQMFAVFDHYGMTRDSAERIHGRGTGDDKIPDPGWFLDCIDSKGNLNEERLRQKAQNMNLGGLDNPEYYAKKRKEYQMDLNADAGGSGVNAGLNMLSAVYKDPRFKKIAGPSIATMAGLALGALAKEKGIVKTNRGIAMFGAVANALSFIPAVRRTMDALAGPDSELKDSQGYTNRQKAMAKIMNKLVPLTGFGMGAGGWYKVMSKMGPAGQILGLVGAPFAGFAGMAISKGMQGGLGQWLFGKKDKDAGWFSKLGKFIGGAVPNKFRRLVTGGINDEKEWEVYAASLRSMRGQFEAAVNEKTTSPRMRARLMQEYDNIIAALDDLPDDDENSPETMNRYGILRGRAERLLKDQGSDKLFTDVNAEFTEHLKENELKLNDKIDPRAAKYVTADEDMLSRRLAEAQANGTVGSDVTLEDYRDQQLEAIKAHMNNTQWSERYDQVAEDMKKYFADADIDAADLESVIDLYRTYVNTPASDINKKSNAYHSFMRELTQLDANTISMLLNSSSQDAMILYNEVMNYAGNLLGETNKEAIAAMLAKDPELAKFVDLQNMKPKEGFFGIGPITQRGKEALRGKKSALEHADLIAEMMSHMNRLSADALRYRTTSSYTGGENAHWTNSQVDDSVFEGYRQFARDASKDAQYRTTQDGAPIDTQSWTADSGQGFSTDIKDRKIPKELLSVLGITSKSKWSMDDFSKVTIGGRSGSAVGCSVATMNNILHFLNLPEISTNTLAVLANLHTNSTGVKFTFFKEVCNRMALAYAVYNSKRNRFNKAFFKRWIGDKNTAFAVLLNNYNGSGHFVFCGDYKDNGTFKMIDPLGKGREERISVNDIAIRASIVITITKTAVEVVDRNMGSFSNGLVQGADLDEDDINEDDGIISGAGTARDKLYGNRGKSKRNAAQLKTTKQRLFGNRGYNAGTAAVLDKLTSLESVIAESTIVNANDKQQAKKIQSTINKIDPDTKVDSSTLSNLANSPEVVKDQKEDAKTEEAVQRTAAATEALAGAKPGENPKHAYRKYAKAAAGGLLSLVTGLPKLLAGLFLFTQGAKLGWEGMKVGGRLAKRGWERFKDFTVGNLTEESRDQQVDPSTGALIDNGHFKDVSKGIQGVRDLGRYTRVGLQIAKSSANVGLKIAGWGAKLVSKYGEKAGKIPGVGKLIKGFLGLPLKLVNYLLDSKLGKWLSEKGLTKTFEWFRAMMSKLMNKIAPKLSKKIAEKSAKKSAGGFFKRLPGVGLAILLVQAFYAAYQGWKHAGQLLKVNEDLVDTGLRAKVMFAKLMYDVGPELLCAILKLTPGGFAGFAMDVAIIVLKEMFTWDVIVDTFGIGEDVRRQQVEANKSKTESDRVAAGIDKEDKVEKYDSDKQLKDEALEQNRSRSINGSEAPSVKSNAAIAAGAAALNGKGSTTAAGALGLSNPAGSMYQSSPAAGFTGPVPSVKMSDDKGNSIETGDGWVKYIRADGTAYTKKNGSLAWRTNNPGNIMWNGDGSYVRKLGAIGYYQNKHGKYAVFPSEEAGWNAMRRLLFIDNNSQNYKGMLASKVFAKYAPSGHGANDPNWYANEVVRKVGSDKILNQYNEEEQYKFMAAIRQVEGWKAGTIDGNMKSGSDQGIKASASQFSNMAISNAIGANVKDIAAAQVAKSNAPAGLTESDIATPSKTSAYRGPMTKAQMRGDDTNYKALDKMLSGDKTRTASTNKTTVAEFMNTSFGGITSVLTQNSAAQTTAIVGAIVGLGNIMTQVLNVLNNKKDQDIRNAAAGAK